MSGKREKEFRQIAKSCNAAVAQSKSLLTRSEALLNQAKATVENSEALYGRIYRHSRKLTRAEIKSTRQALVAGFLVSSALSGAALVIAIANCTSGPAPIPASTPNPIEIGAIMAEASIPAPVQTVSPYCEAVPLTEAEQLALQAAADEYKIPYPLALAIIDVETDFRNVTGDSGASVGYMQVQPQWHQERMEQLGVSDLTDPASNFRVGLSYLAEFLEDDLTVEEALMCYNMGPSGAAACWGQGVTSSAYSREVVTCADYWSDILA